MMYAGRSVDSLPFIDEVARFGERVEIRTDDVGGVPTAAELLGECPDGTTVYACGPAPMLTAIRAMLAGRDNVELHFERFAAPPVVDGREFSESIASTGQQVVVGAEETLLTALRRSDVAAPYSCQQGFCGTCRTRVVAGTVDHRDTLLTDPERAGGMMLVCISRAADGEHLILDLQPSVLCGHAVGRWSDLCGLHHRAASGLRRHGRGVSGRPSTSAPAGCPQGAAGRRVRRR